MTTTPTDARAAGGGRGSFTTRNALTALLVLLYVAARLWRLTAACLWFDEIFGVHAARHGWGGLWRFVAADLIHPPLFYALLKLWTAAGGESLLWLRLLPALASIAAVVPLLLLARELRLGAWATNAALLVAAANGYLVKYAQEVRMYGLLLLFTLTSLWLFARLLNTGARAHGLQRGARGLQRGTRGLQLALFVVNLLLAYTHYYGWLVVTCEAALLVFRRDAPRLRAFLPGAAGLVLAYAPWVLSCARAASAAAGVGTAQSGGLAQNIGWIARPGAGDLVELFTLFNQPFYFRQSSADPLYARGGAVLGLLLVGLPVVSLLFGAWRRRRMVFTASGRIDANASGEVVGGGDAEVREGEDTEVHEGGDAEVPEGGDAAVTFLLAFTLLPVALAFAASYLLPQSVWGTRHLIVSAGPYALLAGLALERLRPAWWKAGALMLVCCWFALVGILTLARRPPVYVWCAWEGLAASAAAEEARAAGDANASSGADTTRPPDASALRPADAGTARPSDLYAFEDLVAYHLWFALERGGTAGRFRVVSVKGASGVAEDAAYFLPRDFDGVAVGRVDALQGERFWAAFRDTAWDESRPPLKLIIERGYRAERIYESGAQGQRAFLVLFTRAAQTR